MISRQLKTIELVDTERALGHVTGVDFYETLFRQTRDRSPHFIPTNSMPETYLGWSTLQLYLPRHPHS